MLQDAHLEIPMSNNDDDNVNTTERKKYVVWYVQLSGVMPSCVCVANIRVYHC
jgi:hypothetical protein